MAPSPPLLPPPPPPPPQRRSSARILRTRSGEETEGETPTNNVATKKSKKDQGKDSRRQVVVTAEGGEQQQQDKKDNDDTNTKSFSSKEKQASPAALTPAAAASKTTRQSSGNGDKEQQQKKNQQVTAAAAASKRRRSSTGTALSSSSSRKAATPKKSAMRGSNKKNKATAATRQKKKVSIAEEAADNNNNKNKNNTGKTRTKRKYTPRKKKPPPAQAEESQEEKKEQDETEQQQEQGSQEPLENDVTAEQSNDGDDDCDKDEEEGNNEEPLAMLQEAASVARQQPPPPPTNPLPNNNNSTTTNKSDKAASRKATDRLRKEFETLQKEMEVAHDMRKDGGNLRRQVPRARAVAHTKKRKTLEREDEAFLQEQQGLYETSKRLRGSKAAQSENVIRKSLIFRASDQEGEEEEDKEEDDNVDEDEEEVGTDRAETTDHAETDHAETDCAETDHETDHEHKSRKVNQRRRSRGGTKRRTKSRKMARLRAFRSQRLAQREGEAIGLHIQGRHELAIQKLKELAADAPSAPQVYSALGTVYEAMLKEMQKDESTLEGHDEANEGETDRTDSIPPAIHRQIKVAKKAYGGFHVAAILFKKDYSLWVRGADLSTQIADLYADVLAIPNAAGDAVDLAQKERKRWLQEAKNDYQAADNLNPPGIDVGARLATVYIELGNLSEALTLLTDLKERKHLDSGRTAFDTSYRAWLLYADLMLRIGFECQQWNNGDTSNGDYMFRRWLRKHSTSFDWRERRMQALAKALEAAAGTKCCADLLAWLKERAAVAEVTEQQKTEEVANGDNNNATVDEENGANGAKPADGADEDKALLDKKNEDELANFDQTTADMQLPEGSKAAEERALERTKLFNRLNPAITKPIEEIESDVSKPVTNDTEYHLPLSASVRTVYDIASQLMIFMINCELFDGCYLVGEAVSLYMKERSNLIDGRRDRLRPDAEFDSVAPGHGASYDILEGASDDENSVVVISDDEDLENTEDHTLLDSMRRGVLPPLLLTFYGLALLAARKRRYLALKCVESLNQLPLEDASWFDVDVGDSGRAAHLSLFTELHRNVMGRRNLLAMSARVMLQISDDKVSTGLFSLFEGADGQLASWDVVPGHQVRLKNPNPLYLNRLSCLLAISAGQTHCRLYGLKEKSAHNADGMAKKLSQSLKRTTSLCAYLWKPEADGSLPNHLMMALRTSADAFQFLCRNPVIAMKDLHGDVLAWLSSLCSAPQSEFLNFEESSTSTVLSSSNLPLDVDWHKGLRPKISLRCHNFVVATAVQSFSGWTEKEFSSNSIRHNEEPAYVGLRTSDGIVCGRVSEKMRLELIQQWVALKKLRPDFVASERISNMLGKLDEAEWFEKERSRLRDPDSFNVAIQGENEGLWICIFFSRISLSLAESTEHQNIASGHIFNALSVLLPLSQFALNERLWGSNIGLVPNGRIFETAIKPAIDTVVQAAIETAKEDSRVVVVAPSVRPDYISAPSVRPNYVKPCKRPDAKKRKQKPKKPFLRLDSESEYSPLSNLVAMPCLRCRDMWGEEQRQNAPEQADVSCMSSLHEKLKLLRNCYSVEAVERASLEIAAGLLAVADSPLCENLFLVLNQAANFASKGRRGGNNDRFFKAKLPRENGSPRDMLLILGRADCLNAIGFVAEASFLVSFVLKHCGSHRGTEKWSDRWKLVAIYAYNVSVMARANRTGVFGDLFVWSENIIKELDRARLDGMTVFGAVAVSPGDEEDEEYASDEDEEPAEEEKRTQKKRKRVPGSEKSYGDEGDADDEEDEEPEVSSDESESKPTTKRATKRKSSVDSKESTNGTAAASPSKPPPEIMAFVEELDAEQLTVGWNGETDVATQTLESEPSQVAAV